MPTVSIVKGTDPQAMVRESIKLLGGIETFIKPNEKVLIKPNLCTYKTPETGATTDPRVLRAIIELIQPITRDISIVESNVAGVEAETVWKLCGYYELAEQTGVKLINLSSQPATAQTGYRLPDILFEKSVLINVPKIKTNEVTMITVGLKNLFGLISNRHRAKYHKKIDQVIVDLNKMFKTHLTVVDGLVGMEGNGPVAGDPIQLDLVLAGQDVVAVDSVVSSIIGVNPTMVPHIVKSVEAGIGIADPLQIDIKGQDIKSVKKRLRLPSSIPWTRRLKYRLMEHSEMFGIRQGVKLLSWWRRRKNLK